MGDLIDALTGCRDAHTTAVLWIIATAFAVPLGVQAGWGAVMAINLQQVAGIGPMMSGWIGCISTLSGCVGGGTWRVCVCC